MSSKNYKEVHGNKRHVANTAGMEQRRKSKRSSQRKSESAIIQRNPNGDRVSGTTPLSTRIPSATQDPLIDTESDDDVLSSVVATRKIAPVTR